MLSPHPIQDPQFLNESDLSGETKSRLPQHFSDSGQFPFAALAPDLGGQRIGPYLVEKELGHGGMATVYRAWHTGLHRFEALKVPRRGFDGVDNEYIRRLLSEARLAARLHHPNIVAIHNISEDGAPHPYFSMDLVEGNDLSKVLTERGALPLDEAVEIIKQVGSALAHAHANGVVHRDVKPENILLQNSGAENSQQIVTNAKVVDFGISRAAEDQNGTRLTRSGIFVGTPEYMSPEQSGSGEPVDYRTDIYSLGVVAYEMLSGSPPFTAGDGVSRMAILIAHVQSTPALLHEIREEIPAAMSTAVNKALSKHPADRFQSAAEFVDAINLAMRGEATAKSPALVGSVQDRSTVRESSIANRLNINNLQKIAAKNFDTNADNPLTDLQEVTPQVSRQNRRWTKVDKVRRSWAAVGTAVLIGALFGWLASSSAGRFIGNKSSNSDVTIGMAAETTIKSKEPNFSANRKLSNQNKVLPVRKVREIVRISIPFKYVSQQSPRLVGGQRKVTQIGRNGIRENIVETTKQGSRNMRQRVLSGKIVQAPIPQIEIVGTRVLNLDNVPLRKISTKPRIRPRVRASGVKNLRKRTALRRTSRRRSLKSTPRQTSMRTNRRAVRAVPIKARIRRTNASRTNGKQVHDYNYWRDFIRRVKSRPAAAATGSSGSASSAKTSRKSSFRKSKGRKQVLATYRGPVRH